MNMLNKLNGDKEAQEKKYEEKAERNKLKKHKLAEKLEESQKEEKTTTKDSLKLLTEMFNTQKTEADDVKGLFREILDMKDHEIHNLKNHVDFQEGGPDLNFTGNDCVKFDYSD